MELVLAIVVIALGATVQRTVGFGAALVSVPLLLLIDPRLVPGPVVVANLVLVVMMSTGTGGDADQRGVRWMVLGLLPGTVLGALALSLVPDRLLAVLAGSIVLAAVVGFVTYGGVPLRRRSLAGGGALSGFMGTTAGVGGPPIALLYSDAAPPRVRATLSRVFLANWFLTMTALAVTGHLDRSDVLVGVAMMPGGLLGVLAGRWVSDRIDGSQLKVAVLALSATSAVVAIARALL